jgi:hypothetical protein
MACRQVIAVVAPANPGMDAQRVARLRHRMTETLAPTHDIAPSDVESAFLSIFPTDVSGSDATKTTRSGT